MKQGIKLTFDTSRIAQVSLQRRDDSTTKLVMAEQVPRVPVDKVKIGFEDVEGDGMA